MNNKNTKQIAENVCNDIIDTAIKNMNSNHDENRNHDEKKKIYTESKKRSCVKALVWRGLATLTTMSISYFYLGDFNSAAKLGLVDMSIKLVIHYMYERSFAKIKWGYVVKD